MSATKFVFILMQRGPQFLELETLNFMSTSLLPGFPVSLVTALVSGFPVLLASKLAASGSSPFTTELAAFPFFDFLFFLLFVLGFSLLSTLSEPLIGVSTIFGITFKSFSTLLMKVLLTKLVLNLSLTT